MSLKTENEETVETPETKPEEKPVSVTSDADSIVSTLIEKAPEVSEHVVAQEQVKISEEQATAEQFPGFDPEIHETDENGHPISSAKRPGEWRKKRGRRTTSNNASSSSTKAKPSQLGNLHANIPDHTAEKMAGQAAANSLIMLGITFGGDEWHPVVMPEHGINEQRNLEKAFSDYFIHKGIKDFPPGVALSLAVVGYMAPRFAAPKTKTKLQKIAIWFKERKLIL